MTFMYVIVLVFDPIRVLYNEFVGTIVLMPYFFSKIVNVNKDLKEDETEENIEGEKEYDIPENMVYNEDGEGVINGKTIRQLEYEAMQNAANDPEFVKTIDTKKIRKEIQKAIRDGYRKKVKEFIRNNIEIIVGICISVFLVCIYFILKNPDTEQNISLIGSIIGAEGAMLSVLISIAFMKKSNEKALDASVLPYLTIEKEKKPTDAMIKLSWFEMELHIYI